MLSFTSHIGLAGEIVGFAAAVLVDEEPCEGCYDNYDAEHEGACELAFVGLCLGQEFVARGGCGLIDFGFGFHYVFLCIFTY